jgi:uncharacterized membrane protein YgcG
MNGCLYFVVLLFAVWIAACSTPVKRESPGAEIDSGKVPVPQLTGRINDTVNLLSPADQDRLSDLLGNYEQETGHQMAVLTVPTLAGEAIESFCLRTAKAWRLGRKGIDDGVVVCMAMKEKSVRIELGIGINRYISNADASEIIVTDMTPSFAKGDFAGGLERGIKRLMEEGRRFIAMDVRIVEHIRDLPITPTRVFLARERGRT